MNKLQKNRSRKLQYENLERRELLSVSASLKKGVLNVSGTKKDDAINFVQSSGTISIAGVKGSWSAASVSSIKIELGKGNDTLSFRSTLNGGTESLAESITVTSKNGVDAVLLADGHDVSLNGKGHTLTISTLGVATLDGQVQSWNPSPTPPTPPPPTPPAPTPPPPPPTTNWFDAHIVDAALRTLGHNLYVDGTIDRNDMVALFKNVEDGDTIDRTEFDDLKAIVANSTLFGTFDSVWKLSSYIVSGNYANNKYQGQALGNLNEGSNAAHMEKLIGKWFLGTDRPTAGGDYRQIAGQLFVGGVTYQDIKQGYVGDCYLMSSLAETALKNPSAITNMFIVNGDGTYTVRFFNYGVANYVTVDSYLPTNGAGQLIYANLGAMYNNSANELWTALAEKAFVQINEMGWVRSGLPGNGQNSYAAIESGYIFGALSQITGQSTVSFASTAVNANFDIVVTAFNQGKSICFASMATPASSAIVAGHGYAVVSCDATAKTVTLFNPWGTSYALVTMTWAQIQQNFSYFDRTA